MTARIGKKRQRPGQMLMGGINTDRWAKRGRPEVQETNKN